MRARVRKAGVLMAAFANDPMWSACFGGAPRSRHAGTNGAPSFAVSQLPAYRWSWNNGEKFPGGFGPTEFLLPDYWTLRARSAQLFKKNIYARGIVRRLVTNEINTGLHLEATPEEKVLGVPEDSLADWAEDVENRFAIWAREAYLCDHDERLSYGAIQALARQEALVVGDVLCVLRQDQRTRLPRLQLINGSKVRTPFGKDRQRDGNRVEHGVEIDKQGRHVAYWIQQHDDTGRPAFKRLPAYGEKSGRRLAWLYYGSDKRMDEVRGEPLLGIVFQSLQEIDKYRDSTQRKALINSMLAMFVTKTADKPGTRPLTGGAIRRGLDTTLDTSNNERSFRTAELIPGLILDELQQGEEPKAFPTHGTDEKFGDFEEAIVQGVAWCFEIPPEILRLSFSSNYSASQAAINEFKIYLNRARHTFAECLCQPVYQEWLVAEVLAGRIKADGLLEAWRDPGMFAELGAWMSSDWAGQIKPAVDLTKLVKGYEGLIAMGACTRDRASRELTGTKYSKNVQKLARENEQLAAANKPIAELDKPPPPPGGSSESGDEERAPDDVEDEEALSDVATQTRSARGDAPGLEPRRSANGRAANGAYPQA